MLTIATLLRDYRSGRRRRRRRSARIFATHRDEGLSPIWISLADEATAIARARARRSRRCRSPAMPFAVKDNIDVAGMPTTAGCPSFAYVRRASVPTVVHAAARRRRDPHRQDEHGSVRDRARRHALAVRRLLECLRRALHLGRIELGFGRGRRQGAVRVLARHRHRRFGPRAGGVQQSGRPEADARRAQHRRRRAGVPVARLRVDLRARRRRRAARLARRAGLRRRGSVLAGVRRPARGGTVAAGCVPLRCAAHSDRWSSSAISRAPRSLRGSSQHTWRPWAVTSGRSTSRRFARRPRLLYVGTMGRRAVCGRR